MKVRRHIEQVAAVTVLGGATLVAVSALIFILVFVFSKGIRIVTFDFLFQSPREMGRSGGIFPALIGSIILPLMAVCIALPAGLGTAVYLAEYTTENRLTRLIRIGTDCLAGIPSILFGLFGFIFFVTIMGMGWSLIAGALTLAIMVLPTIIRTSEEAIRAVPYIYREVSYSLGATRWETVWKIVLPSALPGIVTGVMLSVGRCVGETAAVIFTAGVALRIPLSAFDSVRTLAVHFYILAREGISMENAYGTAAVLVLAVLVVNTVSYGIMHHFLARRER